MIVITSHLLVSLSHFFFFHFLIGLECNTATFHSYFLCVFIYIIKNINTITFFFKENFIELLLKSAKLANKEREIFRGTNSFQVVNGKESLTLLAKTCVTALPYLNRMREQSALKGAYIRYAIFY